MRGVVESYKRFMYRIPIHSQWATRSRRNIQLEIGKIQRTNNILLASSTPNFSCTDPALLLYTFHSRTPSGSP